MAYLWVKDLARLYLPLYQYESDKMRIIYAGYSSIKKNHFARLLLEGNYGQNFLGRRLYMKIPELIKERKTDIVVAEISRFTMEAFQRSGGFVLPELVIMRINIDRPLSEICDKNRSDFPNVTRRIRKYNLTCEILKGKENFDYFVDKLYMPYITRRHGDEALIEDMNRLWELSPAPFIMAVKENGVIVAESLIRKSGEILYFMRLGLLNGDEEYLRHGAIGALYYFGIIEGQKMGCRFFDVGGTRPFFTDGLTKYKLGLGAEFVDDYSPSKEHLWLGINENSPGAKEFVKRNPFMSLNKEFRLQKNFI
jgi:hypothetical protein